MKFRLVALILTLALGLLAAQPPAEAQKVGKVWQVGLIFTTSPVSEMEGPEPAHPAARAFVQALRERGYVERRNLVVERRSAEGQFERFRELVAELVHLEADVIVVVGAAMAREAQRVTNTVPLVMVTSGDPEQAGLVASIARPGGNLTGLTTIGREIAGKRLQLLKEAFPEISRAAYLGTRADWEGLEGRSQQAAARALGVTLLHAEHDPNEYAQAFTLISQRADAVLAADSPSNVGHRRLIVDFAAQNRLPATYPYRVFVEAGGLMSYGVDIPELFRGAARYVDRILKGADPAELPIEQPTKFELAINLKTAKAIGLTIRPSLLFQAAKVIQ